MPFPLGFDDISLWLAIVSIVLLVTSELLSPYYGKTNTRVDKKKLRKIALATSILFLATVAIRILAMLT